MYSTPSASSTEVERAFSKGGLTVSKMRHSLSDKSIRAVTVLRSWCDMPDIIPCEELASKFADKLKRLKGEELSASTDDINGTNHIVID
jgi:hypothetical protein